MQFHFAVHATIGPLGGIEPAALGFWCSALTNWATESVQLSSSNHKFMYIYKGDSMVSLNIVLKNFWWLGACLYERRDGTFAGTGRWTGSRHVYISIIFITRRLYGSGTFFVPSRASGIPVCATGIPPQPGLFLSCKHLLPGRDGRRDDFGVLK